MADRAAAEAVRFDRAVELEPMRATERKIVHTYLSERGDVETHSEGDEPDRRLVVAHARLQRLKARRGDLGVSRETLEGLRRRFGLSEAAIGQFERMLEALAAEADPHTTVSDPAAAVDAHLADSLSGLSVEEVGRARRIADVGSGAGFPGLALAVALPSTEVDLIESSRRKTAVAARLAQAADVTNARPVTARAEEWAGCRRARWRARGLRRGHGAAVAPLAVLVEYAAPLLRAGGVLVAWKGARDATEESGGAAAERLEMVGGSGWFPSRERRTAISMCSRRRPDTGGFPRRGGSQAAARLTQALAASRGVAQQDAVALPALDLAGVGEREAGHVLSRRRRAPSPPPGRRRSRHTRYRARVGRAPAPRTLRACCIPGFRAHPGRTWRTESCCAARARPARRAEPRPRGSPPEARSGR